MQTSGSYLFCEGNGLPLGYRSKLMERGTTQVYVRASCSGHGGLGKPRELLQAPDVKEETVYIGTPGLQSQSSIACRGCGC